MKKTINKLTDTREILIGVEYNKAKAELKQQMRNKPLETTYIITAGCINEDVTEELSRRFLLDGVNACYMCYGFFNSPYLKVTIKFDGCPKPKLTICGPFTSNDFIAHVDSIPPCTGPTGSTCPILVGPIGGTCPILVGPVGCVTPIRYTDLDKISPDIIAPTSDTIDITHKIISTHKILLIINNNSTDSEVKSLMLCLEALKLDRKYESVPKDKFINFCGVIMLSEHSVIKPLECVTLELNLVNPLPQDFVLDYLYCHEKNAIRSPTVDASLIIKQ